jgi:SAM-dependent methyltransferase
MTDGKKDEIILQHYRNLAKNWGLMGQMSMQDKVIRERETQFIIKQTHHCLRQLGISPERARILDLGCGNGHLLSQLWQHFAGSDLMGVEFVPELMELAQSRQLPGMTVILGDMRGPLELKKTFDVIITERSVINLLEWKWQQQAFHNISRLLVPGGFYIMVESFQEPWRELNEALLENQLSEVPISSHNRYLRQACLETLSKLGLRKVSGVEPENALSSHFFLSRVFQHLFTKEGTPASERLWEFFAEALPPHVGNYSPIQFHVFQKQ